MDYRRFQSGHGNYDFLFWICFWGIVALFSAGGAFVWVGSIMVASWIAKCAMVVGIIFLLAAVSTTVMLLKVML